MNPSELHRYKDALSTWLEDYPWLYFGTFTSGLQKSPASWRRSMERLNADLRPERLFWGCEANDVRPHVHCLIGPCATDPQSLFIQRGWSAPDPLTVPTEKDMIWRYGAEAHARYYEERIWDADRQRHVRRSTGRRDLGRTDIQDFDSEKGACHYVGKYVTKQLNDYDLYRGSRRRY